VKGNGITMAPIPSRLPSLLLVLLLSACASEAASARPSDTGPSPTAEPSASTSVVVTDVRGVEVDLSEPPERIVSLAPSNTEIVCALGACDRLVGVTDFDDYPAEVAAIPKVVLQAQVDVELVVAAEPDLVLAAGNEQTPTAVVDQMESLGLRVVVLYPDSLEGVYADIELVGRAIHAEDEATDLVDAMRSRARAVVDAVAGADRPRTLYEVYHAEGTTYTAGTGSFLATLLELAGADPVTGDAQGLIGAEDLVAADPEVILLGTASYDPTLGEPAAARAAVAARPGWASLRAVRDSRVVPYLDDIVTTRPGPRIVEGLEALARALHPDRMD
jgi:iron complex transport system substrate-binding protein